MNRFLVAVVAAIVLLACTTASAGWRHVVVPVAPAPVVHHYYPVGPVYAYPAPVVTHVAPVVAVPVYRARVVNPAPVIVRSRVYVRGRPVRHAVGY